MSSLALMELDACSKASGSTTSSSGEDGLSVSSTALVCFDFIMTLSYRSSLTHLWIQILSGLTSWMLQKTVSSFFQLFKVRGDHLTVQNHLLEEICLIF